MCRFCGIVIVVCAGMAMLPPAAGAKDKGEKPRQITGCLQHSPDARTYELLTSGDDTPTHVQIIEHRGGVHLDAAVGHRVTLTITELIFKPGDRTVESTKEHPLVRADRIDQISDVCQ